MACVGEMRLRLSNQIFMMKKLIPIIVCISQQRLPQEFGEFFILSKSSLLIRFPSNLSDWCSVFNPKLTTVLPSRHNLGVKYFEWGRIY